MPKWDSPRSHGSATARAVWAEDGSRAKPGGGPVNIGHRIPRNGHRYRWSIGGTSGLTLSSRSRRTPPPAGGRLGPDHLEEFGAIGSASAAVPAATSTGERGDQPEPRLAGGPDGPAQRGLRLPCSASSRQPVQLLGRAGGLGRRGQVQEVRGVRPRRSSSSPPRRAARRRTRGSSPASGSARRRPRPATCPPGRPARRRPRPRAARRPARPPPAWRRPRTPSAAAASACSPSSSRSQLHSTTARSVWCRGAAVRSPRDSSRNRSSSRAAISSTVSERSRAAASSIASGSPSSARQIRSHRGDVRVVDREAGPHGGRPVGEQPHGRIGERRRVAASGGGSASGATGHRVSPVMPSGSRLVARIRSAGAGGQQPVGRAGRPPRRHARSCRGRAAAGRSASAATSRSRGRAGRTAPARSPASRRPSAAITACGTSAPSATGARSTKQTSPGVAGRPPRSPAGSCPPRPVR